MLHSNITVMKPTKNYYWGFLSQKSRGQKQGVMKRKSKIISLWLACIMCMLLSCETSVDEDPPPGGNNPTPNPLPTNVDANELSDDLILEGATKVNGTMPASKNLADLKMSNETIYLTEGIVNRIMILVPNGLGKSISHVYVQVDEADDYYSVPVSEEEQSDSLVAFYLDFDPSDWDLPFSFPVRISPVDDAGDPIDEFEREVEVEEPITEAGLCEPIYPHIWEWMFTDANGKLNNAPGYPHISNYETMGCCINGTSQECLGSPPNATVIVDEQLYIVPRQFVRFDSENTFIGQLDEEFLHFDPENTDYCSGAAAYRPAKRWTTFGGNYTQNNTSLSFSNIDSKSFVDGEESLFGSPLFGAPAQLISCHFLAAGGAGPDGSVLQVFQRRDSDILWHD